ncbi:TonB-dependent receptor [Aestuariicella hydrocarbonica]|uniref:TonB-dependent receptor n=1 Tax=Pseudomaricurvus hydrocarbonicus TaxID=1470433 RepID=A0A9E5MHM5_9GAMM|nr:TonB-dependent receptor [Aestuariicella hydrocarbonica]NHO66126.1 TonB-dependent receptor [Aestuariicella hydrocarbonica]
MIHRHSTPMLYVKKALSADKPLPSETQRHSDFTFRTAALPLAISLSVMSVFPGVVSAEERFAIEEVVVTARKREESLQDVPVAVSAFSEQALEMRNVTSIEKVSQFVPNVQFDGAAALSGGGSNATIYIRGIGQNDFALFSDPGVGTYVDGVYLGRSMGGVMDVLDVAQLEVLRGPQGTLFGKNTIGGALNITSKAPSEELGGEAFLSLGTFDRQEIKGIVNLPLIDDVLLSRISLASVKRDGYAERVLDGEDLGDKNSTVGRVQLLWHATEDVDVSLAADYTRGRTHSAANTLLRVNNSGFPFLDIYNAEVAPGTGIVAPNGVASVNDSWITNDPYKTYGTGPNDSELDSWGVSATVDWSISDNLDAKSITAYRGLEASFGRDGDNTPFVFRETTNDNEQSQFSQEFQLTGISFNDKLDWLVGLYYFNEEGEENAAAQLAVGIYDALEALPGPTYGPFGGAGNPANTGLDLDVSIFNKIDTESYAIFSQNSWHFTDRFSATVGARYTRESKEFEKQDQRLGSGAYIVSPGSTWESDWSEFTPKLGLEYTLSEEAMMYVSWSKGFKSGGFNGRPLVSAAEVTEYEPETVESFEVGLKSSWLDNRLIVNTAAFYMDYEDIQLTVNQTPANFVANAAMAELKGVELEVIAKPLSALDINFSAGYLDASYKDVGSGLGVGQVLPITEKTDLAKTPRLTLSGGAQYAIDFGSGASLVLRTDLSYRSEVYHDIANDPLLKQDAFTLVDASVTYTTPGEDWVIRLFGTNLTDEEYLQSGNASSAAFGIAEGSYAIGREWGMSVKRLF